MPLSVTQLVGFGAKRAAAGGGGGGTITFDDVTSNDSSATITIPAGASESGDEFVVLFDTAYLGSGAPTYVLPTDFTEIGEISFVPAAGMRCVASYKILTSGDAGASVTGMSADAMTKHLVRYSFSSAISTITVGDYEEYADNGDLASVTLGASAGSSPLVAMAYASANNAPSVTSSWTPDFSSTDAQSPFISSLVEALIMNSSPSDVTWDPSDVGARNVSITFYLEVA